MSSIPAFIPRAAAQRVTIYNVAQDAGVAISTVSRVINNAPDVSEATRLRVHRAIERLQFRPSRAAKMLARKQPGALAVAVPSITTPAHTELLKGVRDHLRGEDLDLILCDLGSAAPATALRRFVDRGSVAGLLLMGTTVDAALARDLQFVGTPVVVVGAATMHFDAFYWDEALGAELAVAHLVERGHQRIAMITAPGRQASTAAREAGYRRALTAAGLAPDARLVRCGRTLKHAGFSEEAGYEAMQALLKLDPTITAVFAASDVHAIGARKAALDAGRRVPEGLAIVGYDDIKMSRFLDLSSVDLGLYDVGAQAVERLLHRVRGAFTAPPTAEAVRPRLVVRGSS